MITINKKYKDHNITCICIKIGNDLNVSIFGGDKSHIGAVALAIPTPVLNNPDKISSTVSLLTVPGHKEDLLTQNTAKLICQHKKTTVVVSCGIHIKNINIEEIKKINSLVLEITNELIRII